jgi:tetratricopeptide (TPR) repeat protein
VWVPIVSAELGAACVQAGRLPEAIRLLEEALITPWKVDLSLWTSSLGEAHLRTGRLDEAAGHAHRAVKLARAHGERGNEAHVCRLLGEIASRQEGGAAQADDLYRQSLALASDLGMRPLAAHCHRGLGVLYRRAGDSERGTEHLTTARLLYRDMSMSVWLPEVEAALADMGGAD